MSGHTHIRFDLAAESRREVQTMRQLQHILHQHPGISDWIFTSDVRVQANVKPHSHPVLTLNTRHLDDDNRLLASFLHEQLHWGIPRLTSELVAQLEVLYPELPVGAPYGCKTRFSNYLHIVICSLEYQALSTVLGEPVAHLTLKQTTHYQRIYQIVLSDHAPLMALIHDHVKLAGRDAPGVV